MPKPSRWSQSMSAWLPGVCSVWTSGRCVRRSSWPISRARRPSSRPPVSHSLNQWCPQPRLHSQCFRRFHAVSLLLHSSSSLRRRR
ncbi:hypothetical protein BCR44DRAFT_1432398 [Catenaria anguillulae PL171]|uniref:Uncharacterized protein n=1 Tax=Catenaria anguillulae PL171 TaxID=765915 RepID=A0A1Y2HRW0_9FUNG|nr:hypothetical protein BCR44DRAFT_1432398 [Catenaria anguillulae PL171]